MIYMVYETGEIVSLVIALIGYFILLTEFRKNKNLLHLFLAYTFLLVGAIATVVEGFYLRTISNYIEHSVGMALAGLAFGLTAFLAHKKIVTIDKSVKEKMRLRK